MVQISPEFRKTLGAAKAARDERAKLKASVAELNRAYDEARSERRASLEIMGNCEKQLASGNKTDVMMRLATARSAVTRAEQTMAEIERKLADLHDRSLALDDALDDVAVAVAAGLNDFRATVTRDYQRDLEALAPVAGRVASRGYALKEIGTIGSVDKMIIPAADRHDRPLITGGRLRTGGPDDTTRFNLAEAWRDDPQLVAEHDAVAEIVDVAAAIGKERERIARERQARIDADPVLKERQMREYRERCARETEEAARQSAAAREQRDRAEAERQANIDTHRRERGDQLYPPGHPYGPPAKPADMGAAVAGAAASAYETATNPGI